MVCHRRLEMKPDEPVSVQLEWANSIAKVKGEPALCPNQTRKKELSLGSFAWKPNSFGHLQTLVKLTGLKETLAF